ncbi:hypothetical protein J4403_01020 [Candidatus Woesearchaeota archaeon]|nr:hypothetical protein [Candidatus Woesearchaeota archaeon]
MNLEDKLKKIIKSNEEHFEEIDTLRYAATEEIMCGVNAYLTEIFNSIDNKSKLEEKAGSDYETYLDLAKNVNEGKVVLPEALKSQVQDYIKLIETESLNEVLVPIIYVKSSNKKESIIYIPYNEKLNEIVIKIVDKTETQLKKNKTKYHTTKSAEYIKIEVQGNNIQEILDTAVSSGRYGSKKLLKQYNLNLSSMELESILRNGFNQPQPEKEVNSEIDLNKNNKSIEVHEFARVYNVADLQADKKQRKEKGIKFNGAAIHIPSKLYEDYLKYGVINRKSVEDNSISGSVFKELVQSSYSVDKLANKLNLTRSSIYSAMLHKDLEGFEVSHEKYFAKNDVINYLLKKTNTPKSGNRYKANLSFAKELLNVTFSELIKYLDVLGIQPEDSGKEKLLSGDKLFILREKLYSIKAKR